MTITPEHIELAQKLYAKMPGAPRVPTVDGRAMWGEVEDNEHFQFCLELVAMMTGCAQAYAR